MKNTKGSRLGFTLIELMIVVAIIGILAAIAIPKFADLIRKSKEGATKGNLGAVRSALSIYYGDLEGQYPVDTLAALTAGNKYLTEMPQAKTPSYHDDTATTVGGNSSNVVVDAGGGWAYTNDRSDGKWGSLWVNCTHTDSKGTKWTYY